ncbi:hypothetical protein M0802_006637 [Mischocyttarus mexicanus]|nr:hypothetical protein M0802_006637 [Mischocyttarus mexicanus]
MKIRRMYICYLTKGEEEEEEEGEREGKREREGEGEGEGKEKGNRSLYFSCSKYSEHLAVKRTIVVH